MPPVNTGDVLSCFFSRFGSILAGSGPKASCFTTLVARSHHPMAPSRPFPPGDLGLRCSHGHGVIGCGAPKVGPGGLRTNMDFWLESFYSANFSAKKRHVFSSRTNYGIIWFPSLLQIFITSHHSKALLRQTSDMWIINRRMPCHPVVKIQTVKAGPVCFTHWGWNFQKALFVWSRRNQKIIFLYL